MCGHAGVLSAGNLKIVTCADTVCTCCTWTARTIGEPARCTLHMRHMGMKRKYCAIIACALAPQDTVQNLLRRPQDAPTHGQKLGISTWNSNVSFHYAVAQATVLERLLAPEYSTIPHGNFMRLCLLKVYFKHQGKQKITGPYSSTAIFVWIKAECHCVTKL
jgi:hypothetical protein